LARHRRIGQADHAPGSNRRDHSALARRPLRLALYNDVRKGSAEEFKEVIAGFEAKVAQLAEGGTVDLIHPSGAPPFMILGYEAEKALIREWEARYKIPIFTSGSNVIAAMHALNAKRIIGVTYTNPAFNPSYVKYFEDAGFEVLAMAGMDIPFDRVQEVSLRELYRFIRDLFLAHPAGEAIYIQGPSFHMLEIIDDLEQDLGVPIIHHSPASCWEMMKRLHVNKPVRGYGRLIAEMPALPATP
jgi:maleate cis-trans isomerase